MALLMLVAALISAPDAQPRSSMPAEDSDIIVEGQRNRDQQIRRFVDKVAVAPVGGQLSRFDASVCPAVTGLPDAQNQRVASRMRAVARAAAIRVAPANCSANALVIVVDDKNRFMKALEQKYPAYFADAVNLKAAVPKEKGPAIAWHVESLLDSNGIKPKLVRTDDGGRYFVVESFDSSRLKPPARPHFVAGILVIERSALNGLSTTQLADYAAMRLYIRTKPERLKRSSAPTILNIIDTPMGAPVPLTMTAWDFAVLKSLYVTDPMQFAAHQRVAIVSKVKKELEGEKATPN